MIDALYALPGLFKTSLNIAGVRVTDLHTLNNALGASIERSAVDSLNTLRAIWDPKEEYGLYSFVRQSQAWPDVLLRTEAPGQQRTIIMGIELKGWFVLAKEGEPSFRYKVTPAVCADADLLVVLPWMLDEVVSGAPMLLTPFVAEARYAALHRNYYWQYLRPAKGAAAGITTAAHQSTYPPRGAKFLDTPHSDSGGNFGRVSRGGVMDAFIEDVMMTSAAGIPIRAWQKFFAVFGDQPNEAAVQRRLSAISRGYSAIRDSPAVANLVDAVLAFVREASDRSSGEEG